MTTNTPAPAQQALLTDAMILHRWACYVSEPSAAYPLTDADKIAFARAIESALLSKLRAPVADERAAFARAEISFPMTVPGNRVYLAGPMTGHENHNFPAFHAAAERLRGLGLEVVNPADHGLVSGLGWADYMRWDLVKLAGCHSVYVLPGWEKSKGASLEVSIARALGMPVFTVEGAALASAPVAGEAQPVAWLHQCRKKPELTQVTMKKHEPALAAKGFRPVPLYAAPQASEAVRDAEDATRWRWATASDGNADKLCSIVLCHGGYQDKINERADFYRAALSAQPGAQKEQSDA